MFTYQYQAATKLLLLNEGDQQKKHQTCTGPNCPSHATVVSVEPQHYQKPDNLTAVVILSPVESSCELSLEIVYRLSTKWIRENLPDIENRYDVWHVAKSKVTFKLHHLRSVIHCLVYF